MVCAMHVYSKRSNKTRIFQDFAPVFYVSIRFFYVNIWEIMDFGASFFLCHQLCHFGKMLKTNRISTLFYAKIPKNPGASRRKMGKHKHFLCFYVKCSVQGGEGSIFFRVSPGGRSTPRFGSSCFMSSSSFFVIIKNRGFQLHFFLCHQLWFF